MTKPTSNKHFLEFHTDLMGYEFHNGISKVPIYILYWKGYKVDELLSDKTKFTKTKRKKDLPVIEKTENQIKMDSALRNLHNSI